MDSREKISVGVITYHRAVNYGAFLQAYGLVMRLNQEPDLNAEIIDFNMQVEVDEYGKKYRRIKKNIRHPFISRYKRKLVRVFADSVSRMPLSSQHICSNETENFIDYAKDRYDLIICGSDELWKYNGMRGFPTPYWLPGDLGSVKASYAVSSNCDPEKVPEETKSKMGELLSSFSLISVRDRMTLALVSRVTSSKVLLSPDPSFIYHYHVDAARGRDFLQKAVDRKNRKKILLLAIAEHRVESVIATTVAKALGDEYALVSVFSPHVGYRNVIVNPFEWINLIAAADIVCTTLFHGVCFSIINEKPFVAFVPDYKENKIKDVAEAAGFSDRVISSRDFDNVQLIREKAEKILRESSKSNYPERAKAQFEDYMERLRKVIRIKGE